MIRASDCGGAGLDGHRSPVEGRYSRAVSGRTRRKRRDQHACNLSARSRRWTGRPERGRRGTSGGDPGSRPRRQRPDRGVDRCPGGSASPPAGPAATAGSPDRSGRSRPSDQPSKMPKSQDRPRGRPGGLPIAPVQNGLPWSASPRGRLAGCLARRSGRRVVSRPAARVLEDGPGLVQARMTSRPVRPRDPDARAGRAPRRPLGSAASLRSEARPVPRTGRGARSRPAVDALPAPIDDEVDDRRAVGDERLPQRRLERRVVLHPHARARRAPAPRRRSRSARGPSRGRRARSPVLVGPDHPVALVVEDERRSSGGPLARRSRPRPASSRSPPSPTSATTAGRDGRGPRRSRRAGRSPSRPTSSRGTCPGRRKRKPRAAQRAEAAGVGRHDRVVGQELAEGRDDLAGMDAGAAPGMAVDHGRRLPGRAILGVARRSGRRRRRRRARPRDSRRATAARRNSRASAVIVIAAGGSSSGDASRRDVDVRPARPGAPGSDQPIGRDLAEPRADHEHRVGVGEALADGRRRAVAGHAEVQRVVVRDHVAAAPRGDDRARAGAPPGGRGRSTFGRAGRRRRRGSPAARRSASSCRTSRTCSSVGRGGGTAARSGAMPGGHLLVEEVLGDRQDDRARPAVERLVDRRHGGLDGGGDVRRLRRPLREAPDRSR